MEILLPLMTIIKVFASIVFAFTVYKLWPLLSLVFLSLFLTVTLHPMVEWLEERKFKRWAALSIVIVSVVAALGISMALVIPALIDQMGALSKNIPTMRDEILRSFPLGGFIRHNLDHLFEDTTWAELGPWVSHLVSVGNMALGGLLELALLLVIAFYLLVDGGKTYQWILAFFSREDCLKIQKTSEEISQVIFGYVAGQAITSALVMVYCYAVLMILNVPGALMLSVLAGLFDILPILGFFVSTGLATLLALSVSPRTAFIVLILYLIYHALENYLIIPKVYGKRLRLSTLTVLLGLLAGGLLAGIPGAIVALPVVASYAVIEQVWLRKLLGSKVIEKHEDLKNEEFGEAS